jgi:plasmid stabilization system protein ParE
MAYQIIWSPEAERSFDSIVNYLQTNFTEKEVANFIRTVNRRLLLMKQFPKTGNKLSKTSQRRKAVLHKRAILYYRILERKKEVRLLTFFDTRQDPKKGQFS